MISGGWLAEDEKLQAEADEQLLEELHDVYDMLDAAERLATFRLIFIAFMVIVYAATLALVLFLEYGKCLLTFP